MVVCQSAQVASVAAAVADAQCLRGVPGGGKGFSGLCTLSSECAGLRCECQDIADAILAEQEPDVVWV